MAMMPLELVPFLILQFINGHSQQLHVLQWNLCKFEVCTFQGVIDNCDENDDRNDPNVFNTTALLELESEKNPQV